jgi:hypothetical protein
VIKRKPGFSKTLVSTFEEEELPLRVLHNSAPILVKLEAKFLHEGRIELL